MTCNKCGANIDENSKFCGYCGSAVEGDSQKVIEENIVEEIAIIENDDLGKTVKVEPIETTDELLNNNVHGVVNNNQELNSAVAKNNNKLIFIIVGIVLGAVAIALAVFLFLKSSTNSLAVLQKAINNMYNKGETSATVETTVTLGTPSGEGLSFSLTVKTEAENQENYKTQITLNRSLFFEEMNLYSLVNKSEMMVYLESSLVDMLGMTSSLEPTWLYYKFPLDEVETVLPEEGQELDLSGIIDEEHFKYIDTVDGLKHYTLIIDQKLINNAKSKLSDVENEELKEMINSMEELKNSIKIEFYITKSDELSKIELNMSEFLQDAETITSFVISMELKDMGSTKVNIPNDALNSTMDVETYVSNNSKSEESDDTLYEDNYDSLYNTELSF